MCSPVKLAKKSDHSAGVVTGTDLVPERVFPGRSVRGDFKENGAEC